MKTKAIKVSLSITLAIVMIGMMFPLIYMVVTSLKDITSFSGVTGIFKGTLTFDNYIEMFSRDGIARFFVNSLIVAIIVTVGNIVFCLMSGYALARRKFIGNKMLFIAATAVLMIPQHVVIIPVYILISKIGMHNTYWALILPWLVNPLGIFLMRQYIANLPEDCEQAARIDGAGEFTILFRIVMPLCKPALAVLAVQVFLTNWNSFLYPFILTSSPDLYTLPVGLAMIQGLQQINLGQLMAGSTIAALPVIIVFLFFQRHITEGITAGALKG
ncbi:MAG: carbohydrate ABC transporter permease [candidate division Zixibacteria bacterium]|nr:carbohydrate ABC transporter permease [candidate division Zixibacteria bacterium]